MKEEVKIFYLLGQTFIWKKKNHEIIGISAIPVNLMKNYTFLRFSSRAFRLTRGIVI